MRATILTILGFVVFHVAFAQMDFRNPVELPLTGGTSHSQFGDVDGDGDNDVVFSTTYKSGLFVLYNDNAVFNRIETVSAPRAPQFAGDEDVYGYLPFSLHDMNADGVKDIVVSGIESFQTDNVSIFSFVTGKFEKIASIEINEQGVFAIDIHCADLNKDEKPDIVLGFNSDGAFLLELESNEEGGFTEKKINTPGIVGDHSIMADINSDGNPDLILTSYSPKIAIYKSNDEGVFAFDQILEGSETVFDIEVGDFNGDQKNDIVALNGVDPGTLDFYAQGSNGFFIKLDIPHTYETIFAISAGDVDNDNDIDLAYEGKYAGIVLMLNDGNGSFTDKVIDIAHGSILDLDFADIDGDNFPEVLPSKYEGSIEIFKKNGTDYESYTTFEYSSESAETGQVSDLNNDGLLDLVLLFPDSKTISVAYNSGEGRWFEKPNLFKVRSKPILTRICRVNDDELNDIIYTTLVPNSEATYGYEEHLDGLVSDDHGMLELEENLAIDDHFSTTYLEPGDFNNDGFDDLHSWFFTLYNDGNGKFNWVQAPDISISISSQAVADFNHDGFDDVALGTEYSNILGIDNSLLIRWGQDQAVLASGPTQEANPPGYMTVANMNNDEFPDLVCHDDDGTVTLLINNGDGTFVSVNPHINIINWFNDGKSYAVTDLDADGDDDLAVTTFNKKLFVYTNDGTGTLAKTSEIEVPGPLPFTVLSGKINRDKFPDLILLPDDGPPIILINDFVIEPTIASSVVVSERTSTSVRFSFEGGDGDSRLLILREGEATNTEPVDNTFYAASAIMSNGTNLGSNNYVVFADSATSVVVTHLKPNTTYFYTLFESDGNEKRSIIDYLTSTTTSGSFTTKLVQVITFSITDKTEDDPDFILDATTTSSLPITYELVSGGVTINENMVTIDEPGRVSIKALQGGNDEVDSTSVKVRFCVDPRKPTITVTETGLGKYTLTSSSDTHNIWYIDDSVIDDAHDKTYEPGMDGAYSVIVEYGFCFTASEVTANLITGIHESTSTIAISPNPVNRTLFVKMDASERQSIQPKVFDMTGRIYHLPVSDHPNGIELDVKDLPTGVYILKVRHDLTFKFIKE